jgi:hypothetical protein
MTRPDCEAFLADRESNPTHVESCDSCREEVRRLESLDARLEATKLAAARVSISPDDLPVAAWEGASTRSWVTVLAVAAVVLGLGLVGFVLLGISPLNGFVAALSGAASTRYLLTVAKSTPNFLATAPLHVHLMIFAAFIVVNVIFVALLRRRLRGYDA